MAKYRQIQTTFWSDPWVMDLTPEKKYFYLYLLTNDKVKQCGIYEIPLKKMEIETGYNRDTILLFLSELQNMQKIIYNLETNEICVINFSKYNFSKSPQVKACINKELNQVKDKKLIQYLYGINSLYKDYVKTMETDPQEKEKEKEKEEKEEKQKEKLFLAHAEKLNRILSFFGLKEDEHKRKMLLDTLNQLSHNPELLSKFFLQSEAYMKYKSSVSEIRHSFVRFLGVDAPNGVLNGGWNSENWIFKLEEINKTKEPNLQTSHNYENDRL
jgi:hypothetical protein